ESERLPPSPAGHDLVGLGKRPRHPVGCHRDRPDASDARRYRPGHDVLHERGERARPRPLGEPDPRPGPRLPERDSRAPPQRGRGPLRPLQRAPRPDDDLPERVRGPRRGGPLADDGSRVNLTFHADYTDLNGNIRSADAAAIANFVASQIKLKLEAPASESRVGETLKYQLTVQNNGGSVAHALWLVYTNNSHFE